MNKPYNEKCGNFSLLFPFNKTTENLSIEAYRTQNIKNPTKPNYTKLMADEIKNMYY